MKVKFLKYTNETCQCGQFEIQGTATLCKGDKINEIRVHNTVATNISIGYDTEIPGTEHVIFNFSAEIILRMIDTSSLRVLISTLRGGWADTVIKPDGIPPSYLKIE